MKEATRIGNGQGENGETGTALIPVRWHRDSRIIPHRTGFQGVAEWLNSILLVLRVTRKGLCSGLIRGA